MHRVEPESQEETQEHARMAVPTRLSGAVVLLVGAAEVEFEGSLRGAGLVAGWQGLGDAEESAMGRSFPGAIAAGGVANEYF